MAWDEVHRRVLVHSMVGRVAYYTLLGQLTSPPQVLAVEYITQQGPHETPSVGILNWIFVSGNYRYIVVSRPLIKKTMHVIH